MMNVPGILNGNPEACSKVAAALNLDKPVDGHAPLCSGALCPCQHPHGP